MIKQSQYFLLLGFVLQANALLVPNKPGIYAIDLLLTGLMGLGAVGSFTAALYFVLKRK